MAEYSQRGESLDYKNATDTLIEAGTVVTIGSRIGVAGCDIAPGAVGSIHVEGVFAFAKGSGALTMGTEVAITNGTAAAASGNANGYVAADAAASDTTVLVKINA